MPKQKRLKSQATSPIFINVNQRGLSCSWPRYPATVRSWFPNSDWTPIVPSAGSAVYESEALWARVGLFEAWRLPTVSVFRVGGPCWRLLSPSGWALIRIDTVTTSAQRVRTVERSEDTIHSKPSEWLWPITAIFFLLSQYFTKINLNDVEIH